MNEKILVALGGNAILKYSDEGTAKEQFLNVQKASKYLVDIVKKNYKIAITHGNGPQVGDILLKNELSKSILPPMPLDVCVAQSQGMIGYMLQQSLYNELRKNGLDIHVITILTQTLVDENDPLFNKPTKPIGPFYTSEETEKLKTEKDWILTKESGKGFRRVVPSPKPVSILEAVCIKELFDQGHIIIASGGGGIPVIRNKENKISGIEAVIDKDYSAAILANIIDAKTFLILTNVNKVFINYRTPLQKGLDNITIQEAKEYIDDKQFPFGNMGPKIKSAIRFIELGGEKAIITSLENSVEAIKGKAGTIITQS